MTTMKHRAKGILERAIICFKLMFAWGSDTRFSSVRCTESKQVMVVCSGPLSSRRQEHVQLTLFLTGNSSAPYMAEPLQAHEINEPSLLSASVSDIWGQTAYIFLKRKKSSRLHYKLLDSLCSNSDRGANIDQLISVWMWLCSVEW